MRFLTCSRDPLRGSAWSRCKNPWFFAISNLLARPMGFCTSTSPIPTEGRASRLEIAKKHGFLHLDHADPRRGSREHRRNRKKNHGFLHLDHADPRSFCDFCGARATLCGNRRGRGAKTQGFWRLLLFELVLGSCLVVRAPAPGTGGSRVRFLPGPRAGVARCNLHFTATCAEQQLAQSKLHKPTCADQLAPTSLRRAPCLVLSRACFTKCREKERILQRWADLACDVLLSGQPWSSFLGGPRVSFAAFSLRRLLGHPRLARKPAWTRLQNLRAENDAVRLGCVRHFDHSFWGCAVHGWQQVGSPCPSQCGHSFCGDQVPSARSFLVATRPLLRPSAGWRRWRRRPTRKVVDKKLLHWGENCGKRWAEHRFSGGCFVDWYLGLLPCPSCSCLWVSFAYKS